MGLKRIHWEAERLSILSWRSLGGKALSGKGSSLDLRPRLEGGSKDPSGNCLAPPHVPESHIARFIPQCIYSPCYICVIYSCCLLNLSWDLSCSCFLFLVSVSCHSAQSRKLCSLLFVYFLYLASVTPPPLAFSLVFDSWFVYCYMFIWIPNFDSVLCTRLLLSCLLFLYFVLSDNLVSDFGLCVDYDFCLALIKSLFHITPLCICVPSIPIHFTFHNNYKQIVRLIYCIFCLVTKLYQTINKICTGVFESNRMPAIYLCLL